jgi:hypothetical protein
MCTYVSVHGGTLPHMVTTRHTGHEMLARQVKKGYELALGTAGNREHFRVGNVDHVMREAEDGTEVLDKVVLTQLNPSGGPGYAREFHPNAIVLRLV